MRRLDGTRSFNERLNPINRLLFAILATIILFIILGIGSTTPLDASEAERLMKEFEDLMKDLTAFGIFVNNFKVALLSLIPFIGAGIMGFVVFQTGKLLGCISAQSGIHPVAFILFSIIMVYGLMEFLGYGVAASEGMILSYSLIKRRFRSEIRWLIISIVVSAALLFAAAALESYIVDVFKELILSSAGI